MATLQSATTTTFRTCPLCEAGCGLEVTTSATTADAEVLRIRGDREDVFSRGYICPKGSTLKHLHDDPDRVRRPLVKGPDGAFVEASWDEAWATVERLLGGVIDRHGRSSLSAYIGNPNAHNLGALLYGRFVMQALGTKQLYSASTVDQRPKEISSGLLFGASLSVPVPDIDRTDLLVMLGANPYASNGSLATAPDWPGRIEALIARGGRLVVLDPRRSRTAEQASEHVPIRPGTDAFWLFAIVNVLDADGLIDLGALAPHATGLDEVVALAAPFTPEAVEPVTGVAAERTRRLAQELATAERAVVYGRIGTTTQEFGTIASWLVDVVNALTGNLDRVGGAMFSTPAAGSATTRGALGRGRGIRLHRHASRVRGLGETLGELPVAALAEEIDTPGEGQVRALVTVAGNPVLSTPNGERLDAALASLEAMISVDIYVNETTRHADVILPVPDALAKSHYDVALLQLALRNVANYSPPVIEREPGQPDEWEVLAKLALVASGEGAGADPATIDELAVGAMLRSAVTDESGPIFGRDPEEILAMLAPRTGPERLLDLMVRTGPYGDGFARACRDWAHAASLPDGVEPLTLAALIAKPHGIDLGPLVPRLPGVLRTPSGKVELAPEPLVADVQRLRDALQRRRDEGSLVLVGRRHLRSNNSWMHNLDVLVKGKARCTLQMHPDDAARLGLLDGAGAEVSSRVGRLVVPVEVTDSIMAGVVSIPHGWGHDKPGAQLGIAAGHAGVNSNVLTDEQLLDALSGNAVLNGIPVTVAAVHKAGVNGGGNPR
ncbi:MAG: molybdopterin oxidoreductase family protein [Acidimicrobiales bacterium]